MLNEMTAAPDFALSDAEGRSVRLSDLRGQWVVLYFYPRDNTPGCTRQACAFAAAYDGLRQKGAVVVGVSKDSAASHKKFAEKHGLPFVLLSDPDHAVLELYDVWKEKKQYGKVSMGTVRSTYIIDPEGVIRRAMPKVKPDTNAADVLAALEELGA
ncbi:MAG TPA: peroxiredoxin [Candidatus Faecalibacterium faecipullorum]|uniref:thioredoxin-dependent peroxiredoxin n=1 Tax=Candidatus Faecalibacterium faecipullorum TaxID=2838578 RepID=A0A9D2MGR3_9FIRM|nr:peroxiredoxin [Candidatus Faecalibacterium faecipullorum]